MVKKRILYWISTFVLVLIAIVQFWSYRLCYIALHPPRDKATYESMGYSYPQISGWLDSIRAKGVLCDTTILNDKNERLYARWIAAPEPTNRTAVVLHGYQGSSLSMLMIGYMFNHDLGFNVLLPDLRGHGESEGGAVYMGWEERHEVIRWIEIADEIFGGNTQIVIHGISMGGATTMIAAGDSNLPPTVRCAIEDCGYTSVQDAFSVSWDEDLKFLKFPLFNLGDMWCRILYGWGFSEASPLNCMRDCNLPMLFIHGEQDSLLPVEMVHRLYEAKPGKKELWILPGVDHGAAYLDYPKVYTERVQTFVEDYFE